MSADFPISPSPTDECVASELLPNVADRESAVSIHRAPTATFDHTPNIMAQTHSFDLEASESPTIATAATDEIAAGTDEYRGDSGQAQTGSDPGVGAGAGPGPSSPAATRDDVYFALSNQRRRFVLDYLTRVSPTAELRKLSAELAAWENDIEVDETTAVQRKRAYVSLHQNHLPKLDDLKIIRYDASRGEATLVDDVGALDLYLEATPRAELPWAHFYLGLGAIAGGVVAATWIGLPPFDRLPALILAGIVVLTFCATAAIHAVHTARSRIGTDIDLLAR